MTNEEAKADTPAARGRPRSTTAPVSGRPSGRRPREPITPEDRRRRPAGSERKPLTGFADGIERVYCAAYHPLLAERFPVHARDDVAIRKTVAVDERPGRVLLCNGGHPGPHVWPDGEPAASSTETTGSTAEPDEGP